MSVAEESKPVDWPQPTGPYTNNSLQLGERESRACREFLFSFFSFFSFLFFSIFVSFFGRQMRVGVGVSVGMEIG